MNARQRSGTGPGGEIDRAVELGLCSTCNHMEDCLMYRNLKTRIVQCEQFDDYQPVPPRPARKKTDGEAQKKDPQTQARRATLRGLCADCRLLATCCYPKPAGGVWHCEDYE